LFDRGKRARCYPSPRLTRRLCPLTSCLQLDNQRQNKTHRGTPKCSLAAWIIHSLCVQRAASQRSARAPPYWPYLLSPCCWLLLHDSLQDPWQASAGPQASATDWFGLGAEMHDEAPATRRGSCARPTCLVGPRPQPGRPLARGRETDGAGGGRPSRRSLDAKHGRRVSPRLPRGSTVHSGCLDWIGLDWFQKQQVLLLRAMINAGQQRLLSSPATAKVGTGE
jgi:hypothetical protein